MYVRGSDKIYISRHIQVHVFVIIAIPVDLLPGPREFERLLVDRYVTLGHGQLSNSVLPGNSVADQTLESRIVISVAA